MNPLPYDPSDPISITKYADKLIGKSLREAIGSTGQEITASRGDLGSMVEKLFYGWTPPTNHGPDFPAANLELKTTGVKKNKDGSLVPKERLVLGMINYSQIVDESYDTSYIKYKTDLMLILFYLYENVSPVDRIFLAKKLWEMPLADLEQIKTDWELIANKIRNGKANELSEGDTMYLGACTKGIDSSVLVKQPNSNTLAKPRAYSFKPSYVRTILADKELSSELYGNLLEANQRPEVSFDQLTINRLSKYYGKDFNQIYKSLGNGLNLNSKNVYARLTNRMLGIKSKRVSEFEKAGITIKTIRLGKNGTPKEDISFPAFKYTEIINQKWEESEFSDAVESKFLFIVYQETGKSLVFKKALFWNMPYKDRLEAQKVWDETVKKVKLSQANDLPSKKFNKVSHVRPHAKNAKDTYPLPNGTEATKKCFWLNASYIASVI